MSLSQILLIILTVVLAILGIVDLPFPHGKMLKIILSIIAGILIIIFSIVSSTQDEKIALFRSGTCILHTKVNDSNGWLFNFGSNNISLPARNKLANDEFNVFIQDNNLNIQATVRDFSNNILAYVNGNTFHAQASGVEFNCDDNAVEVKDSKGNIVFQLIIDSLHKTVYFYGITFPIGSGNTPTCSTPNGLSVNISDSSVPDQCQLNPIFKYPVGESIGQRI